jgi:hypothetical protein
MRLMAPGQPVPSVLAAPAFMPGSFNAVMPVAPQQSAHLERLVPASPAPPSPTSSSHVEKEARSEIAQELEAISAADVGQNLSVAKKNVVRENTTTDPLKPSVETIEQKASSDPVVQEIIKTFAAKIVDIRPK